MDRNGFGSMQLCSRCISAECKPASTSTPSLAGTLWQSYHVAALNGTIVAANLWFVHIPAADKPQPCSPPDWLSDMPHHPRNLV